MAFFARPNLDNTQFKQLVGSELTLSGQTQIATISGLTLTDGTGTDIIVTASGASNNFDVLTYCDGIISLKEPTASGGTSIYNCASPTTCTVGGLPSGTAIYGSGITTILECILVPTLNPTLTNPSISSFTINPTTSTYEVASTPNVTGITCFNPGAINPQYTSACSCRSDGTQCYEYLVKGVLTACTINAPSNTYPFGSVTISAGNNTISATVYYSGGTQPYDSSGAAYCAPLVASATTSSEVIICGLYPWYWGTEASGGAASGINRPSSTCIKSLITGGTTCKCVGSSNDTLYVEFNSTNDDYLWFAIPNASTPKTCWYETALNSGAIGGSTNLFPDATLESDVCSSSPVWSGQTYQIYVSNYQTASSCPTSIMQLINN